LLKLLHACKVSGVKEIQEIGLEQARPRLGEIVDKARLAGTPTHITRQGKPAAVVVGAEWYAWVTGVLEGARTRGAWPWMDAKENDHA
jgi:prevent-host-death family protein